MKETCVVMQNNNTFIQCVSFKCNAYAFHSLDPEPIVMNNLGLSVYKSEFVVAFQHVHVKHGGRHY